MWAKQVELLLMSYLQPMEIKGNRMRPATPVYMYFTALLLLIYVFMRAMNLSMTHDEAHTYLAFHDVSVWSCFWSSSCWENANNHLLNTLLMQGSVTLFGPSEWAIRLPNVMAYALYLLVSVRLVSTLAPEKPGLQWVGFILLNMNPYLLDFFSLARGYGLSVSFMLTAIWFLFRWMRDDKVKDIGLAYGCLGLAVLSNFTALNILASFMIAHGIIGLSLIYYERSTTWKRILKSAVPGVLLLVLLGIFLALPIRELRAQGEFLYGAPSLWDTISILVSDTLYSQHYLGNATVNTALILFLILLIPAIGFGLGIYFIRQELSGRFYISMVLILLASFGIMLVQHRLLGSQFLFNRKALMYIPLLALILWLFIRGHWDGLWMRIGGSIVAGFMVYHELRAANLTSCREWWYDADTKSMMLSMQEITKQDPKPVSLGLNWLFMPASEYYRVTRQLDYLQPLVYDKEIQSDGRFDYYYIDAGDWPKLEAQYDKIVDYGGRYLLRKKTIH